MLTIPKVKGNGTAIIIQTTVPDECPKCGHSPMVWAGHNDPHHVDHYDCAVCDHRVNVRIGAAGK